MVIHEPASISGEGAVPEGRCSGLILLIVKARISAHSFSIKFGISSEPHALVGLSFANPITDASQTLQCVSLNPRPRTVELAVGVDDTPKISKSVGLL